MAANIDVNDDGNDPNANTVYGAIASIAGALGNILQPYKTQELALRGAISADPSLAQKLRDLEEMNPGAIAQFAGPHAAKFIHTMNPTAEAIARVKTRPQVQEQLKDPNVQNYIASNDIAGKPPGAIQQDILQGKLAQQGVTVMQDPNVAAAAGYAAALRGKMPGQYESDQQLKRRAQAAQKALQTPDLQQEWVKLVTGQPSKMTWLDASALAEDPASKFLIIPFIERMRTERYLAGQKAQDIRAQMSQGKTLDDIFLRKATELLTENGGTSVSAYLKLLGAPQTLIDATGGYTEQQLQDATQTMQRIREQAEAKTGGGPSKMNQDIFANWDNYSESIKDMMAMQLNINARNALLPYTYVVDSDGNLMAFDTMGKEVQPGTTFVKPRTTVSPSIATPPGPTSSVRGGASSSGVRVKVTTPAAKSDSVAKADSAFSFQKASADSIAAQVQKHDKIYKDLLAKAPKYSEEIIRGSTNFKLLTEEEQKKVLAEAKR
jgi:hypothetical protein